MNFYFIGCQSVSAFLTNRLLQKYDMTHSAWAITRQVMGHGRWDPVTHTHTHMPSSNHTQCLDSILAFAIKEKKKRNSF